MRTVIYDPEDMEPLTVVEIPAWFVNELEAGKRGDILRFAISEPPRFVPQAQPVDFEPPKIAEVRFEPFLYRGKRQWMVFAVNPEICLLLKAEFLAGQQSELQRREKDSFAKGFLNGMLRAME